MSRTAHCHCGALRVTVVSEPQWVNICHCSACQRRTDAPVHSGAYFAAGIHHMNGRDALAFSRDRHDFPQSDIIRTSNQGRLILDAMRQLRAKMQSAAGEFKLLALLGRHAQLDGIGIKDLYHLGRLAFSLDPNQIKNITVPYTGGSSCLTLGATAAGLFADFRDDALLESH